jgi:pimeloyl-ACP methyl ester carboxylesterase
MWIRPTIQASSQGALNSSPNFSKASRWLFAFTADQRRENAIDVPWTSSAKLVDGRSAGISESKLATIEVDFLEAGSGPLVMLVHSSVSGARQWRALMDDLKSHFHVRAVNLFGYGKTPPWPAEMRQSLADQARLVEAALPADSDQICLVGHSFGGAVAMKVAARMSGRIAKLVLLEPIPFHLLGQAGRMDAFAEVRNLRNVIKKYGAVDEWAVAAERFADYWTGAGTWREMSLDRRFAFSEALRPNFFEWDAVMDDTTPVEEWAAVLPPATLLAFDPAGVSPTREIAAIIRRFCPSWTFEEVRGAGHMAPLTRPDLINPLVCSFLESIAQNKELVGVKG